MPIRILPSDAAAVENDSPIGDFLVKKSRFTEQQIVGILKESEAGVKTPDLCRKLGVSSATFYKWSRNTAAWKSATSPRCAGGNFTRGALAIEVDTSINGSRVTRVLDRMLTSADFQKPS
jgi:transposase-like protein